MQIPFVQIAKMQITFQWQQSEQPTIAKVREYVQSPTGQDAVAILKEMFSDEGFMYGGSDIARIDLRVHGAQFAARTAPVAPIAEATDKEEGKERKKPPRIAFLKSWRSTPTSSKCRRWLWVSASKTRRGPSGSSTRFIR